MVCTVQVLHQNYSFWIFAFSRMLKWLIEVRWPVCCAKDITILFTAHVDLYRIRIESRQIVHLSTGTPSSHSVATGCQTSHLAFTSLLVASHTPPYMNEWMLTTMPTITSIASSVSRNPKIRALNVWIGLPTLCRGTPHTVWLMFTPCKKDIILE